MTSTMSHHGVLTQPSPSIQFLPLLFYRSFQRRLNENAQTMKQKISIENKMFSFYLWSDYRLIVLCQMYSYTLNNDAHDLQRERPRFGRNEERQSKHTFNTVFFLHTTVRPYQLYCSWVIRRQLSGRSIEVNLFNLCKLEVAPAIKIVRETHKTTT